MLSEADAVTTAKRLALFAGWEWREPHSVRECKNTFEVVTNRGFRGMNIRISIDKHTSKILTAVYPARQGIRTLQNILTRLDMPDDLAKYLPTTPDNNVTT